MKKDTKCKWCNKELVKGINCDHKEESWQGAFEKLYWKTNFMNPEHKKRMFDFIDKLLLDNENKRNTAMIREWEKGFSAGKNDYFNPQKHPRVNE